MYARRCCGMGWCCFLILTAACGQGPEVATTLVSDRDSIVLVRGQSTQLAVVAITRDDSPAEGTTLSFATSQPSTATVSETGLVVAVAAGRAVITVTGHGVELEVPVIVLWHPDGVLLASRALSQRPYGVAVSSRGRVYVTRLDAASMAAGDIADLTLPDSIPVGSTPTGVAFSPDGALAYVTNQLSSTIGKVDVERGIQTAALPVPGDPFFVAAAPDGLGVYATLNTKALAVIKGNSVVATIAVGEAPNGIAFAASGEYLYVSAAFSGEISEIDRGTNTRIRTIAVAGVPQGIVLSPTGTELYVANEWGALLVVDVATGLVVDSVGAASRAFDVALGPAGDVLYVSRLYDGEVVVLDGRTLTLLDTIETGGRPRRVAFDRFGSTAVIANEMGWVDFVK